MGPIIGITTRRREVQSSAGTSPTHTLNDAYTLAVERAGGRPILLVSQDPDAAPAMLDRIDGLILSGGGDIVPDSYGGIEHATVYGLEPTRDAFEFALVREAQRRRFPMLAICRGMQVLNVALGGTLYVDILDGIDGSHDHFLTGDPVYDTPVTVTLEEGCDLAVLAGSVNVRVNSIHHQSVREPGRGLRVVGVSDDGVAEAVQHTDADWPLLGVQWHPEYLSAKADPFALAIFEALIEAAS
jgi:putative glutamine amidotransferase